MIRSPLRIALRRLSSIHPFSTAARRSSFIDARSISCLYNYKLASANSYRTSTTSCTTSGVISPVLVEDAAKYQHTDAYEAIELALDSVVKIFTVSSSPNYFLPWQNKPQRETMGSGFVISGRRILTNAHVVADHTFVLVRKHGSPTKYRAEVQAVGHECDLALLAVESEEFWEGMRFLDLGDIPFLQEAVAVVGYPQGGDNISVTKGVVSRVEPTQYVHGATQLMAIQIDAAINPGNSGGPAIMGDKVAGVAFQNLSGAENIGYIIPVPVIKHFIHGVEECGKYTGFCSMGVSCQTMENVQLREDFSMKPDMTGVLVSKINPLSDAHQVLQKDDIILSFDGVPIANDGTVPFRNRERITFDHLVSMKKPNEAAQLRVLRDGVVHELTVILQPLQPLVPVHQFDKLPRYYIFAGLVFIPLTQPYLHEYGDDWYNASPRRLCERALRDMPKKSGEQLVILSQVLMDDINAGYERLAELQVNMKGVEAKFQPIWDIVDRRWDSQMHRPLHAAALYLNPGLYYDYEGIETSVEIKDHGLFVCISRLAKSPIEQERIFDQLNNYRHAIGGFGIDMAIKKRKEYAPVDWWLTFGTGCPELLSFAVKILGLTCSASPCERNLSTFERVKKVNNVEVENLKHLCELVECCTEKRLRLDLDEERVIVLQYDKAKLATSRILKRHRIPSAMSSDLLDACKPRQEVQVLSTA